MVRRSAGAPPRRGSEVKDEVLDEPTVVPRSRFCGSRCAAASSSLGRAGALPVPFPWRGAHGFPRSARSASSRRTASAFSASDSGNRMITATVSANELVPVSAYDAWGSTGWLAPAASGSLPGAAERGGLDGRPAPIPGPESAPTAAPFAASAVEVCGFSRASRGVFESSIAHCLNRPARPRAGARRRAAARCELHVRGNRRSALLPALIRGNRRSALLPALID